MHHGTSSKPTTCPFGGHQKSHCIAPSGSMSDTTCIEASEACLPQQAERQAILQPYQLLCATCVAVELVVHAAQQQKHFCLCQGHCSLLFIPAFVVSLEGPPPPSPNKGLDLWSEQFCRTEFCRILPNFYLHPLGTPVPYPAYLQDAYVSQKSAPLLGSLFPQLEEVI